MKYNEFHKKVRKAGWVHARTSGSHYIYEKEGLTYPVPYHGSKEVPKGLQKKIEKDLGL